jgi:Heavy metal binding domain
MAARILVVSIIACGLVLACETRRSVLAAQTSVPAASMFACPMHPDVRATMPGKCSRCGMALIAGGPVANDRFVIDLSTVPGNPRPAERVRLRFTVRRSEGGEIVRNFVEIGIGIFNDLFYGLSYIPAPRELSIPFSA